MVLLCLIFGTAVGVVLGYLLRSHGSMSVEVAALTQVLRVEHEASDEWRRQMSDTTTTGFEELDAALDAQTEKLTGIGNLVAEEGNQIRAHIQQLQDAINRGVPRDQLLTRVQRLSQQASNLDQIGEAIRNLDTSQEEPPA